MNNNTQESKVQLEYINKCTEIVKEKYEKEPAFFIQNAGCQMNSLQTETVAGIHLTSRILNKESGMSDEFPADRDSSRNRKTNGL